MSIEDQDTDEFQRVLQPNGGTILGMVMKAAIEVDLFNIMAKLVANDDGTSPIFADDARKLSSEDIVAHLPTQNPTAPAMLTRILRFLAANSILNRTVVGREDGREESLYGLASICRYYIADEDGVSLALLLVMLHDEVIIDSWFYMKDAVLEGGIPFTKARDGNHTFELPANISRFNNIFNQAMHNSTTIIMKKILQVYTGFEELTQIIDVGGGTRATLARIISKYPQIKGTNFDLPHVIKNAAPLAGVEHVGGDMFESVPKGEVIFMKSVPHDWSDEQCLKLLNNCCYALPEFGKVIIVELVVPEYEKTDDSSSKLSSTVMDSDMIMLGSSPGGKERSLKEFEALGKQSGFATIKLICNATVYSVLEFHKKLVYI